MVAIAEKLLDFQSKLSTFEPIEPGFDTLALHAGAVPDPTPGALLTPI